MRRSLFRAALAALCLLAVPAAGLAQDDEARAAAEQAYIIRWATNNSLFVLYHEMAHLLVHKLSLPVLGKEEDAADNMASWILLRKGTPEASLALADAARGWQLSGIAYGTEFDKEDFYDSHSLNQQRAYQIVCLMVGNNAEQFGPVAREYAIDQGRQSSCRFDYEQVDSSFTSVLQPHWDKNTRGTRIEISYNSAAGRLSEAAEAFRESGIFEDVAEELRANYSIPGLINFRAKRCGESNAFYSPSASEVIFCYELMDSFMDMIAENLPEDLGMPEAAPPAPTGLGKADKNQRQ